MYHFSFNYLFPTDLPLFSYLPDEGFTTTGIIGANSLEKYPVDINSLKKERAWRLLCCLGMAILMSQWSVTFQGLDLLVRQRDGQSRRRSM
ncbi:hypothetical protein PoB_000722800 [Plakobranchus ocellatus]|uniref:Uncharacterized protein n=1 Tax=Plakobranchus ocellatus TaxID=259542 RepID=A0AAV3YF12_9GAST|nr:hypothetical protein PoB_000722800 [Plakobranchus ocellatus]